MKRFFVVLVFAVVFFACPALGKNVIESKIDGDFEGFDEDNVYKLNNGQIWIQTESRYYYYYAYMHDVIIFESNGRYYMKVDGVSDAVEVEQLR